MTDLEHGIEVFPENDSPGDSQIAEMLAADEAAAEAEAENSLRVGDVLVEDASDVDSLPRNFKSVEALAKSYLEAQRHFNRLTQRAKEADELEALLEDARQVEQMTQQFQHVRETDDWKAELALIAAQAQEEVRNQLGWQAPDPATPDVREALTVAYEAVANAVGPEQWERVLPIVEEFVRANPTVMRPAVETNDPSQIASSLMAATQTAIAANEMRSQKILARGLPSAGGRPSPVPQAQQEWDEIRSAAARPEGRYW